MRTFSHISLMTVAVTHPTHIFSSEVLHLQEVQLRCPRYPRPTRRRDAPAASSSRAFLLPLAAGVIMDRLAEVPICVN